MVGGVVGSDALLSSSPSLIWLQLGFGLAGAVTIHTPPSLPIQSNVDLLIVYSFKHLKEDYSLLAMAYFK